MSSREDQDREAALQPKRVEYALSKFKELGIEVVDINNTTISFIWKGSKCQIFPYSGWHSGKTIKDGRGIDNLLKQLK